jgi:hypothetical protein
MTGTPIAPIVTALTVARLHNLGNYEHVRYEVTVALPDGAKPSEVLSDVTEILADLRPSKQSQWDIGRARTLLAGAEPPVVPDDAPYEQRRAREVWEQARELVKRDDAEQKRVARAQQALNDLGGTRRYTDAKASWDDEDQF